MTVIEKLFMLVPSYNLTNSELNSYLTKITKCLRDPCELVRRHTFILLSRLLQVICPFPTPKTSLNFHFFIFVSNNVEQLRFDFQRDYVKWRGVLFLRFLLSLVDESEKIRQLADFLFGNILKGYKFYIIGHCHGQNIGHIISTCQWN